MKFLSMIVMVVFGTSLLIDAVIIHEPPAFIAYAFGILTGLCWAGLVGLYWLRQADEDETRDGGNDINGSD